ncbi:histidine kinase [Halosimplex carlsbadense 2-9-1]|uniref:histidine kinase n=1 Tax=Halosimplex carlsbadense 2-9-1 TaxID=797114 RepID=M0CBB1_9EURY|nr:HAMP domain-containing sensor histidine kinase [Halosimplex carlsbadense]ELZ20561.1 histidine kinase [Halosimplex carlsbadense 2-9-1]
MIRRTLAVGSVALTGVALVVGAASNVAGAEGDGVALALVALGAVLGTAIVAGAAYLYRSDVATAHTGRIAGWNLLGVALLGVILALARLAPGVEIPAYVVVDVLGVSSVAHLLIGYNDVRRIRAEELARQRRTLAVVNRLTRHNLRNRTQILTGHAAMLAEELDDDQRAAAETIRATAGELADVDGELAAIQTALNGDAPTDTVDLADLTEDVIAPYRDRYPDGEFAVDVPEGLAVHGDDQLVTALDHLVENAVEHGSTSSRPGADDAVEHGSSGDPYVRVSAETDGGLVTVDVTDRGPGVPDDEVAVLTERREISQLEHGSGLGLWVVKTVAERYGGDLAVENDEDGATVSVGVPAA